MKKAIKILKKIGILLLSIIIISTCVYVIKYNYKNVLAMHRIKDVHNYAKDIEEISIPDDVKIVGLGEATHGNIEFQELKLTVLKKLVEEYGFKAFALELNYSESVALNQYIQGGEGDVVSLLNNTSYIIYHTTHMADLVDWMREYNATAKEQDKLSFYGLDMQDQAVATKLIIDYCNKHTLENIETDLSLISNLSDLSFRPNEEDLPNYYASLNNLASRIPEQTISYCCEQLKQYLGHYRKDESWTTYRDKCMVMNLTHYLSLEKERGNEKMMIAGHCGHIYNAVVELEPGVFEPTFGKMIYEKYKDAYYIIGTEFFTSKDNINTSAMVSDDYERKNHLLCSSDTLAYQAKYMKNQMYYLDYSEIQEGDTYNLIHSKMPMSQAGEGYSFIWRLFPYNTYKINIVPADCYNGMIYVYHAHPITATY